MQVIGGKDMQNTKKRTQYKGAPKEIAEEIKKLIPEFEISYSPDHRQQIADGWPKSIDDSDARTDWGWKHDYDLSKMVTDMLPHIKEKLS